MDVISGINVMNPFSPNWLKTTRILVIMPPEYGDDLMIFNLFDDDDQKKSRIHRQSWVQCDVMTILNNNNGNNFLFEWQHITFVINEDKTMQIRNIEFEHVTTCRSIMSSTATILKWTNCNNVTFHVILWSQVLYFTHESISGPVNASQCLTLLNSPEWSWQWGKYNILHQMVDICVTP